MKYPCWNESNSVGIIYSSTLKDRGLNSRPLLQLARHRFKKNSSIMLSGYLQAPCSFYPIFLLSITQYGQPSKGDSESNPRNGCTIGFVRQCIYHPVLTYGDLPVLEREGIRTKSSYSY